MINETEIKHKSLKTIFKVILVFCLLILFNTSDLLAEDLNEEGDWANGAMQRWAKYGILEGTSEGILAPSDKLTKVEAITILNRINNVEIESKVDDAKYKDVETFRWYYNEIDKAVATGLLTGTPTGEIKPKELVTREVAFVMIAKLFNITYQGTDADKYINKIYDKDLSETNKKETNKSENDTLENEKLENENKDTSLELLNNGRHMVSEYEDGASAGIWASPYIAGLIELGYIDGYEDNTIKPKDYITRGEFIKILDNIVEVIITKEGEYDLSKVNGNVVINVPGVVITKISPDATIYMMAGSNEEVVIDEEKLPASINVGAVLSNIDYAAYKASDDDVKRKKLIEMQVLYNMPLAEMLTNSKASSFYGKVLGTDKWNDLIYNISKEEEIDPVFVKCIMAMESGGKPGTISKVNTNGTRDYGLMQVNSSWAANFDLDRILNDNDYAIRCGIKVIKRKVEAAERSGNNATCFEVAWRYNGYNNKGYEYAKSLSTIYEALSGLSRDTLVRTSTVSE